MSECVSEGAIYFILRMRCDGWRGKKGSPSDVGRENDCDIGSQFRWSTLKSDGSNNNEDFKSSIGK